MDLLQIWCIERSQWPDKQLRSQSAGRVVRRSGGQFSALIAKSGGEQVGGGWRAVVVVQLPVYEGRLVAAARPLHPRSRSRYNPSNAAIQSQSSRARHHRPAVATASQGMSAKLSPTAAKSCHQQLPKVVTKQLQSCHPAQKSPLHTSLVDHLSSSCQSQVLSAQSFPLKHLRRNNRFLTQCNDFVSEAMRPSKHKFVA